MKFFTSVFLIFLTITARLSAQDAPGNSISPIAELIEAGEIPEAPSGGQHTVPEAAKANTHTIQAGDNPWTVAKKYGITMEELLAANQIADVKNLQIGQVLTIPAPSEKPVPETTKTAVAEPVFDAAGYDVYTIKKGDNPWSLAKRLGLDYEALIELNQITNPNDLKIGQKIKIPKKGVDPTQAAPEFDADGYEVYVIKSGDNPWAIAKRLKIDYQKLLNLNQISNPRDLKIGQKIKLPKSSQ